MLVRLWRKSNPSTLLVELQTGAVTVEHSMEFPQKTKDGIAALAGVAQWIEHRLRTRELPV